ncbi:MAG: cache domain-containing protein, partial [Nitrospirae bacterium]|nr:cache domain-containing protein [Nitrospirota bacterium]
MVSSSPQVEYFYGKTPWWQAVVKGGGPRGYVSEIAFDPSFGTHVVVLAAPIVDDTTGMAIGAVTILLRRDTIFHAIAEVTIGATGHAMLFSSDGVPVICPVLAPEEHTVRPELVSALAGLKAGWANVTDDSHGSRNALIGFAPVRFGESLAPGSLGGKQWITVVRQDPQETYAPLAELVAKVLLYGLFVLAVLWGTGVVVARRIARPIQLLHD